ADKFISEYQLVGLGGTSFLDVFRYADDFPKNNAGKRLRGLFFFTDAYGDFPKTKRNYQTTFFVPEDGYKSDYDFVPKWIELVHYNDEDGVN
ncbi:MAG: metallopeptidase, partial [Oscillospiraceae bacterium]|nr:metallopeptidase [Oscillospiraceae bacterium]